MTTERIWFCKVGGEADFFEKGADLPMRRAISKAFREVTGRDPQFVFSGWGQELTEGERAVVENREPRPTLETRVVVDHGRPGADMTAETTFTQDADGSLRVLDVKCYEPNRRHPDCRCNEGYECDRCANIRIAKSSALNR